MAFSNQNKGHLGPRCPRLVLQYYVFIYILTQTLNHLLLNGVDFQGESETPPEIEFQPLRRVSKPNGCNFSSPPREEDETVDGRNPAITSWYGKYPSIGHGFSTIPGGCLGFPNHQHNGWFVTIDS